MNRSGDPRFVCIAAQDIASTRTRCAIRAGQRVLVILAQPRVRFYPLDDNPQDTRPLPILRLGQDSPPGARIVQSYDGWTIYAVPDPPEPDPALSLDEAAAAIVLAGYRALSKVHHPDVGGNGRTMSNINRAYRELCAVLELVGEEGLTRREKSHPPGG